LEDCGDEIMTRAQRINFTTANKFSHSEATNITNKCSNTVTKRLKQFGINHKMLCLNKTDVTPVP
jgi:hypothetical protein